MKVLLPLAIGLGGLSALPALAQGDGPVCSGDPAQWFAADADASTVNTVETPLRVEVESVEGSRGWHAFVVEGEAQSLRIEAEAIGGGDPSLVLATPEGRVLAENDDAMGGLNSRIETVLEPGTYCVQMVPVGDPAIRAAVQISREDQPALLAAPPDLSIADCRPETEAEALTDGPLDAALASGRVSRQTGAEVAYLRFALDAPGAITLRATSAELDPYLKLFDGTGSLIAENDDADGLNSRLDFLTPLAAGEYCIGVAPLSAREGVIDVSAEVLDRDSYLRAAWGRGEMAPPAGSGYPMQDIDLTRDRETVLLHDGTAQWLALTIERPSVLIVDAFGSATGVDSKLVLFGPNGAQVAVDDDGGENTDARLGPVLLEPGLYRMAVLDVGRMDQPRGPIRAIGLVFDRFERVE
ncbi:DVUA0089 family protein [Paracoccus sp. NSM]|uniref:DVUA0089 family protein n=1 Tax=Paracoccus sp. NSM TaxID=3457784 RepID=UPI004036E2DA